MEDANELAWAIEGMQCDDGELLKYLSVLSVEQPGTMQEALLLCHESGRLRAHPGGRL